MIFQKCCPWAQASPLQGSGRTRGKETGWWCDESFSVLMRPSQRGLVSKKLDEDRLVLKRVGNGESFSVGGLSLTPNRLPEVQERIALLFDVTAGKRWRTTISLLWIHPLMRQLFHNGIDLWCAQPSVQLMYVGGKQVIQVSVLWKIDLISCSTSTREAKLQNHSRYW